MTSWARLGAWVAYKWRARSRYFLHSPFLYALKMDVLEGPPAPVGPAIDAFRRQLARSAQLLEIDDYGAGYGGDGRARRTVTLAQAVNGSARRRRTGDLLYRFMRFHQPAYALELGTNLGFSALYQVAGWPQAHFVTVEGAPVLAAMAQAHFERFGVAPVLVNATFDEAIARHAPPQLDYIFLDGHHTGEATRRYVAALLPRCRPGAAILIDDIHWSADMEAAWRDLITLEDVSLSVDLFDMGMLFIRQERAKQHVILNFGFP